MRVRTQLVSHRWLLDPFLPVLSFSCSRSFFFFFFVACHLCQRFSQRNLPPVITRLGPLAHCQSPRSECNTVKHSLPLQLQLSYLLSFFLSFFLSFVFLLVTAPSRPGQGHVRLEMTQGDTRLPRCRRMAAGPR